LTNRLVATCLVMSSSKKIFGDRNELALVEPK
jgi:hypothetical protein